MKSEIKMEEKEEPLTIMTKSNNGMYVCVPAYKLKDFKENQEQPDKKKIEEMKKKSFKEFEKRRKELLKGKK